MASSNTVPVPDFASASPRRKGILWKWSLALTGLVLAYFLWQCGSTLTQGRVLADDAVQRFHDQLSQGQFEQILQETDPRFAGSDREGTLRFFEVVHRKLGSAEAFSLRNIRVNATVGGTYIAAEYQTTFSRGAAVESFNWLKQNGLLKLVAYNVQSKELVLN